MPITLTLNTRMAKDCFIPKPLTDFSINSDEEDCHASANSPQLSAPVHGESNEDWFLCFDEVSAPHKLTLKEPNNVIRDLDSSRNKAKIFHFALISASNFSLIEQALLRYRMPTTRTWHFIYGIRVAAAYRRFKTITEVSYCLSDILSR
ncbi:hypothetical protein Trydic_g14337 [Trypoxylus dichotomus]